MAGEQSKYAYPHVIELEARREPTLPARYDDFLSGASMEALDLGPKLVASHEAQKDYYERQLADVETSLARVSLIYSGQLSFEDIPAPCPPQEELKPPCVSHPGGGCDCGD